MENEEMTPALKAYAKRQVTIGITILILSAVMAVGLIAMDDELPNGLAGVAVMTIGVVATSFFQARAGAKKEPTVRMIILVTIAWVIFAALFGYHVYDRFYARYDFDAGSAMYMFISISLIGPTTLYFIHNNYKTGFYDRLKEKYK